MVAMTIIMAVTVGIITMVTIVTHTMEVHIKTQLPEGNFSVITARCYKIHGYPPSHRLYKGKRLAASVSQEQDSGSWLEDTHYAANNQDPVLSLPTLNSEQYQQLLTLLNKQHVEGVNLGGTTDGAGFMVGKHFSFLTSFANGD